MKLRRKAVLTNLARPRVGMSEDEVRIEQRPSWRRPSLKLLVMAGALGLAPTYKSSSARDEQTSGRLTHEERSPQ